VKAIPLTNPTSKQLELDIEKKRMKQYGDFLIKSFGQNHDRFLIIAQPRDLSLGASAKDLGEKMVCFLKDSESSIKGKCH